MPENKTRKASRRLSAVSPVVVEAVEPLVDGGRFAAKAVIGDTVRIEADVFCHGHDLVRAWVRHRKQGDRRWSESPMTFLVNDRWTGSFVPTEDGLIELEVVGAVDEVATWRRDAGRKLAADRIDSSDGQIGAALLQQAAADLKGAGDQQVYKVLESLAEDVAEAVDEDALRELDELEEALRHRPVPAPPASAAGPRMPFQVTRPRAAFSSWYELFPRSASSDPSRPGTLADVIARLDYVAGLGFDVLYLPPIHPIGRTARKGKGNNPVSTGDDVGSPWAIGNADGGHTAIAPELGTFDDFERLIEAATARGLEVALDLAFQCSPDHPWVREHPEWFRHRPDGSIACAENPPKRYDDIFPLDFESADADGLWQALLDVTLFWVSKGVKLFRVDNPHTKPFAFWEWMLGRVKLAHPDVLFLSEAFTRPKVMHRLAKLGFDQSYTYFTWRESKDELTEYFSELTEAPGTAHFRPNVWPNTPDILAASLAGRGSGAFIARLVLAGGLAANYGIYGPVFELGLNEPAAPGSEEYMGSEKYEVKHYDLDDPRSLRPYVAAVNAARKAHPALQRDRDLVFHHVDNERIICWSKRDATGTDIVIGVVNLDPDWVQSGFTWLDLSAIGLRPDRPFPVHDMLDGAVYTWSGPRNFVQLDPHRRPAHLLVVELGPELRIPAAAGA